MRITHNFATNFRGQSQQTKKPESSEGVRDTVDYFDRGYERLTPNNYQPFEENDYTALTEFTEADIRKLAMKKEEIEYFYANLDRILNQEYEEPGKKKKLDTKA